MIGIVILSRTDGSYCTHTHWKGDIELFVEAPTRLELLQKLLSLMFADQPRPQTQE